MHKDVDAREAVGLVVDGQDCGPCVIPGCEGKVIALVTTECNTDLANMIIGPGSASQWDDVVRYGCDQCGVEYVHPPKKRPRRLREAERSIG